MLILTIMCLKTATKLFQNNIQVIERQTRAAYCSSLYFPEREQRPWVTWQNSESTRNSFSHPSSGLWCKIPQWQHKNAHCPQVVCVVCNCAKLTIKELLDNISLINTYQNCAHLIVSMCSAFYSIRYIGTCPLAVWHVFGCVLLSGH